MKIKRIVGVFIVIVLAAIAGWIILGKYAVTKSPLAIITKGQTPAGTTKPINQIAAPVLPPATVTSSVNSTGSVPASGDVQADLRTALPDIVSRFEADDFAGVIRNYMSPEDQAIIFKAGATPEILAAKEQANPQWPVFRHARINIFKSLSKSTPVMNEAGDKAIYTVDPVEFDFKDTKSTGDMGTQVTFYKINGRWYMSP